MGLQNEVNMCLSYSDVDKLSVPFYWMFIWQYGYDTVPLISWQQYQAYVTTFLISQIFITVGNNKEMSLVMLSRMFYLNFLWKLKDQWDIFNVCGFTCDMCYCWSHDKMTFWTMSSSQGVGLQQLRCGSCDGAVEVTALFCRTERTARWWCEIILEFVNDC